MGVLFVLMVLVVGYFYSEYHEPARYKYKRSEGWHTYIFLSAHGFFFCFFGLLFSAATLFLDRKCETHFFESLNDIFRIEIHPLAFCVPFFSVLSVALFHVFHFLKSWITGTYMDDLKKMVASNHFESMLCSAMDTMQPIMATTTSKKVYVGFIIKFGEVSEGQLEHVKLLPIFSGYRNTDTLEFNVTNDYTSLYDEKDIIDSDEDLNEFSVVIPSSTIEVLHNYDQDVFNFFNEKKSSGTHRCSCVN